MPGVDGIFNLTACLISFQVLYIIIGVFLIMKNQLVTCFLSRRHFSFFFSTFPCAFFIDECFICFVGVLF